MKIDNFLNKLLSIKEELSKYSIMFGILDENKNKVVQVNILNTDNSTTITNMSIADIMYFTEHGTLTIPARPILTKVVQWTNSHIGGVVDNIVYKIIENNSEVDIAVKEEIYNFKNRIDFNIDLIITDTINSNANLSKLLDVDDENKYLFNLNELKKYISCKIIIRN